MSIDFDKTYPWAGIETVTIDGQQMVKIPKFYVKTFDAPKTSKHAGQFCRVVSDIKREGFHVHPAFMKNGKEIGQFYIGAYEASANGSKACSLSGKKPVGQHHESFCHFGVRGTQHGRRGFGAVRLASSDRIRTRSRLPSHDD